MNLPGGCIVSYLPCTACMLGDSSRWRCVSLLLCPSLCVWCVIRELFNMHVCSSLCLSLPAGSPSRGGDVTVYVLDINQQSLPTPFLFCSCVCFCLYGPFNRISFPKFSRQLSAFSLCCSGLISALLVLSTIYLFFESLLQPWYNPLGLTGLKSTN